MAGEGGLKVSELSEQEQLQGEELRRRIRDLLGRSLHIRHVDSGSCNGCDFEMSTLTNPVYDPITQTAEYKACAVRIEKIK